MTVNDILDEARRHLGEGYLFADLVRRAAARDSDTFSVPVDPGAPARTLRDSAVRYTNRTIVVMRPIPNLHIGRSFSKDYPEGLEEA